MTINGHEKHGTKAQKVARALADRRNKKKPYFQVYF